MSATVSFIHMRHLRNEHFESVNLCQGSCSRNPDESRITANQLPPSCTPHPSKSLIKIRQLYEILQKTDE